MIKIGHQQTVDADTTPSGSSFQSLSNRLGKAHAQEFVPREPAFTVEITRHAQTAALHSRVNRPQRRQSGLTLLAPESCVGYGATGPWSRRAAALVLRAYASHRVDMNRAHFRIAVLSLILVACSGSSDGESDAGGAGGGSGGGDGSTMFEAQPPCESDADCAGKKCLHFGASGPSICRPEPMAPLACDAGQQSACCSDAACGDGRCVALVTSPVQCSATAGFDVHNECVTDACASNDDCSIERACTPAGFDSARSCIPADCRTDGDCTAEPGGACVVLEGGCCVVAIGGGPSRVVRLACAYPSDGCQSDADCDEGSWCSGSDGRAHCSTECQ